MSWLTWQLVAFLGLISGNVWAWRVGLPLLSAMRGEAKRLDSRIDALKQEATEAAVRIDAKVLALANEVQLVRQPARGPFQNIARVK